MKGVFLIILKHYRYCGAKKMLKFFTFFFNKKHSLATKVVEIDEKKCKVQISIKKKKIEPLIDFWQVSDLVVQITKEKEIAEV